MVLVWQWCDRPFRPVAITLYPTAPALPTHDTRAERLEHSGMALTFSGGQGAGGGEGTQLTRDLSSYLNVRQKTN